MYCERRRCPLGDENKPLFEEALVELVDNFSEPWLNLNKGHPLQTLWHRRDVLSSIELYSLGSSIQKIKNISPDQLKQNIRLLKSNDYGTMAGAVWEIILAAAFNDPPQQKSRLLGPRMPTYDVEVETADGSKCRISVKNFGQSERDREFLNQFRSIEELIKNNATSHTQIHIIKKGQFPASRQEWDNLKRIILKISRSTNISTSSKDGWNIMKDPLTNEQIKAHMELDQATLYTKELSYTLFMALPFYRNENKNIEYKLNEACVDLINKGAIESDKSKNSLFIHLPEYVSLDDYAKWCNQFYNDNPSAPISFITLFQPVYVTDIANNEDLLAINQRVISRPNRQGSAAKLNITIPIGKPADDIKWFLGPNFEIPKHHYLMQSGRIQVDFGDFTHGGKMRSRFNFGIKFDAIGKFKGEDILFSVNSPPTTKLVLL